VRLRFWSGNSRFVELNEGGISTVMHPLALGLQLERSGLRYVVGDFNNWNIIVYVQTPRKRHRRRSGHIITVGENESRFG